MTDQIDKDARFWDKVAEKYSASTISDQAGYEKTLDAVRNQLRPNDQVLEIGCGTGSTAIKLAGAVHRYVGTDISPEMIRIAREKSKEMALNHLVFDVGASDAASGSNAVYDVILGFNILHLVPDPAQTLRVIHRQLKASGLFISKTPCLTLLNPIIRLAIPLMQAVGKAPSVTMFSPTDLKAVLNDAGFSIEACDQHGTKVKDMRRYIVARRV